jgi:hypothetical protein
VKLDKIADALTSYAQTYNRLPCPAAPNPTGGEPFGAPVRSGVNGTITTNTCSASGAAVSDHVGFIPFLALGLTSDQAKDAYGNFITYKVTPYFAGYNPTGNLHQQCLTAIWMTSQASPRSNRNLPKANFCCPFVDWSTPTLIVQVFQGSVAAANSVFSVPTASSIVYSSSTTLATGDIPATNQTIAFLLVSHGQNGDYAALQGGGYRPTTGYAGGSIEANNGIPGGLSSNRIGPLNTTVSSTTFDDIMLWRTNTQIMSAFGHSGCTRP